MLRLLVNYNGYFWIKTLFIPSLVIVLITFLTYLLIDFIINNDDSGSEDVNGKGEDNEKNQK